MWIAGLEPAKTIHCNGPDYFLLTHPTMSYFSHNYNYCLKTCTLIGVPLSIKLPGARLGPRLFRLEVLVGQRESPTVTQPFVRTLGRERRRYDDRESTQFPSSSSVGRTRLGAIKLVPRSGTSISKCFKPSQSRLMTKDSIFIVITSGQDQDDWRH